jgi:hypothetical protein
MAIRKIVNRSLDKLVCPAIRVIHISWSAFQFCGVTGLALLILLAMTLTMHLGLSLWAIAGIVAAAVMTFLGLVMVTKIITGKENIIYYHHEIAVIAVTGLLLWLLRQPVLPYLDVIILGIGAFLSCGRVGCLMIGCCHGRPHRWGVCYRAEHAAAGLNIHYVGARLFPIQAVESLWVFCIVLVGSVFVLSGYPPGTALALYIITYGVGRFCFEFMRGDPERPYLLGFSEAQWTSLLLMCVAVWAEMVGVLTFHLWHFGAIALVEVTMIAVALRRRFRKTQYQLLHPNHVREVASALDLVSILTTGETAVSGPNSTPVNIHIACTSLGVQISASKIKNGASCIHCYALSHQNGTMIEEIARILAELITQLKHPSGSNELIKGNQGVFHLLVHS